MSIAKTVRPRCTLTLAVIAIVAIAGGCKGEEKTVERAAEGEQKAAAPAAAAVAHYGLGVQPDPSVTYQPDVVLIPNGPSIIRGVSDDGLSWTLDGNAPGVRDLRVGSIMFATSHAVGRVFDLQQRGPNIEVTVLPVQITEVIRDATLNFDHTLAINSDSANAFTISAPESFAYESSNEAHGEIARVALLSTPALLNPEKASGKIQFGDWEVEAFAKQSDRSSPAKKETPAKTETVKEVGVKVSRVILTDMIPKKKLPGFEEPRKFDKFGVKGKIDGERKPAKFGASVSLYGKRIRLRCNLVIAEGAVNQESSSFAIVGVEGMSVGFAAGSEEAGSNVKIRVLEIPFEISGDVMAGPVPLAVYLKAKVAVDVAFSARNSTLYANGTYKWSGDAGYEGGQILKPEITVEKAIMPSVGGVTLGGGGVVFAIELKFMVGLGAKEVAAAGPYGKAAVSLGVSKGSTLGIPLADCTGVTLKLDVGWGVGVQFSSKIVDLIERMESRIPGKVYEELKNDIGKKKLEFELFESVDTIWKRQGVTPNVPVCGGGGRG